MIRPHKGHLVLPKSMTKDKMPKSWTVFLLVSTREPDRKGPVFYTYKQGWEWGEAHIFRIHNWSHLKTEL